MTGLSYAYFTITTHIPMDGHARYCLEVVTEDDRELTTLGRNGDSLHKPSSELHLPSNSTNWLYQKLMRNERSFWSYSLSLAQHFAELALEDKPLKYIGHKLEQCFGRRQLADFRKTTKTAAKSRVRLTQIARGGGFEAILAVVGTGSLNGNSSNNNNNNNSNDDNADGDDDDSNKQEQQQHPLFFSITFWDKRSAARWKVSHNNGYTSGHCMLHIS
eukprot:jgi/Psemu1/29424/gm1.29424_g